MGPVLILCYAYYHHYMVEHIVLVKKKEKERDMCVVLFLFVTGFTKLCFNKLLELLSSTSCCHCEFILMRKD